MPRQNSALESNNFAKGLITEASPLNFPEGASLEEQNFEILRDGTRRRRLGMNIEQDGGVITRSGIDSSGEVVCTTHRWESITEGETEILVVQLGRQILFYNILVEPVSSGFITSFQLDVTGTGSDIVQFNYASVNNVLVVASGKEELDVFEFKDGNITKSTRRLRVRDVWGLKAPVSVSGIDDLRIYLRGLLGVTSQTLN